MLESRLWPSCPRFVLHRGLADRDGPHVDPVSAPYHFVIELQTVGDSEQYQNTEDVSEKGLASPSAHMGAQSEKEVNMNNEQGAESTPNTDGGPRPSLGRTRAAMPMRGVRTHA